MKVLQVATLVTPDGAYGGPIRVAVNQTRALRSAGHEVELLAGASGFGRLLPKEFDDVPLTLFPARKVPKLGFSGTFSLGLNEWLRANIGKWDVVHVHLGRDLITLPTAVLAQKGGIPYVLQTHGMVVPSFHPLAKVVDRKWTVPALRGAKRVLYLTPEESSGLTAVAPVASTLENLHNGVPKAREFPAASGEGLEVLFLARLHERKRPLMFVELAKRLHVDFPDAQFMLVGPDGGQGAAVKEAIAASGISHVLKWEGAIAPDRTAERISRCDVYVLPSIEEPFPMSVLEALAQGKPSVVTDSCGLAGQIATGRAGAVVDDTLRSLVAAVRHLLSDKGHRRLTGDHALELANSEFSMSRVVARLEKIYRRAAGYAS